MTSLERHYAAFDGLNLTWETLEGIAKHNGPVLPPLPHALAEYDALHDLELHTHASAEAQVAALSDDIAYNNHDLHDGLRAGLFSEDEIATLPLVGPAYGEVDALYPGLDPYRRRHEALRRVFGAMVSDVIDTSRARIDAAACGDAQAIRDLGRPVIAFSHRTREQIGEIRAFLFDHMYRAPPSWSSAKRSRRWSNDLFPLYMDRPEELPRRWHDDIAAAEGDAGLARLVADYIAGMTDRFALQQHARLTGVDILHTGT